MAQTRFWIPDRTVRSDQKNLEPFIFSVLLAWRTVLWEKSKDLYELRSDLRLLPTVPYFPLNLNQKKKKTERGKRKKMTMKQGWRHATTASSSSASSSSFFFFFFFSVRLPLSFNDSRRFSLELFSSSFLGTYRLSHCWIFILQPQTFRSHHHFFLFFFSLSLAWSLYHGFRRLLFSIFLSALFPIALSAFFSLSLHFAFAFAL